MDVPPGLDEAILARSFRATNGEIAVLQDDVGAFIDAADQAGLGILGWEAWLADHGWSRERIEAISRPGEWVGLVPLIGRSLPAVLGGSAPGPVTRAEIAGLDLPAIIEPRYLPHVRFNIALEAA